MAAAAAAAAMQPDDTPRSWAELPMDLAAAVLQRLPSRPLDRVRFGAVCPQWRAAAQENPAMPPHFPWLALPDRTFYSLPDTAFRLLPAHLDGHRQLPHAQTSCGELLVFDRQDGAITLMSPFSGAATMVLPGLHTLLRDDEKPFKISCDVVQGPAILKLVVCSDNLVAAAVAGFKLALCRPGAASWSWALLLDGTNVYARDIVWYQGQLYALGQDRSLSAVSIADDGDEPALSSADRVIDGIVERPPQRPRMGPYLLESGGALLMVTKKDGRGKGPEATMFVVCMASFELSRWTSAPCDGQLLAQVMDGRALFLGERCSRSVAVVVGGGSIVFVYDPNRGIGRFRDKRLPFFCGVYDIKTRRSQTLLQKSVNPLKGFKDISWLFRPS